MTDLLRADFQESPVQTLFNNRQNGDSQPQKPVRIGRIRWVTEMNGALADGLAGSRWLADAKLDQLAAGRRICLDLWPFIYRLPDNIKTVKDKLPESLEPAKQFLNKLADEERHYQRLYLKQCDLAGLDRQDLITNCEQSTATNCGLVRAMHDACSGGDVVVGVQAIVAAELAATQFARATLTAFEEYFAQHGDEYSPETVDAGLEWLRLHAKPNTRHALWMNRMLVGLNQEDDSVELPPTVKQILHSIFDLWRVEENVREAVDKGLGCQAINN